MAIAPPSAGKRARNRPLLLAELAAHPGDAYLMLQLGRDAEAEDAREACGWYEQALAARLPPPWHHEATVRLHCLANPAAGARRWRWPTG
jgi:hypothetical protein